MLPPRISKQLLHKQIWHTLKSRPISELVCLCLDYLLNEIKSIYYYRCILNHLGKRVFIADGVHIEYANKISIGNNTLIGRHTSLIGYSRQYKPSMIIGNNVEIYPFVVIDTQGGYIRIGDNSGIGTFCILYGHGGLEIGNDVIIADKTTIIPGNHGTSLTTKIRLQQPTTKGIKIEDDVWIGTNVSILDGVTIGKGSIIGAGSVVTKSIPEYSIAVGIPAKVIKRRT